ncbi:putative Transcriptional regulator, GntR family [Vibrio nigripulchritudo MADA3029]|uniref:Putative Transcriptional regulator, GntR family n=1 Tax=Vibrio nigripulchritudo TaxID=28173 RepID=U4KE32_9VIBR|nr:FadR/GntR family transcriptional regulator [Vibrio nigripulchritudo]EGU60398.1 GntR family transcriptional regulator [Vibrio nigripulchritudo ATCC 27043]CCN46373.1 putative Transcriptional regulator, GntR family [Vibrio nigripulchritudo MADA3020]CCN53443.1 putative Transcriptional regulator, GntR family [Vibrio nigripulchritudo MADA3021]CCN58396.1 putative Transcriptional regulator, GntR family [Vibrio nigripulchritudo MADA3029]CCN68531.1 putative Transcriptional regulator, GntR family [Vib
MTRAAFAFEQTLKNKTKKDILAEKILEMIVTGLLRDGDELPSERELSSMFGVSRETVRGALGIVQAYGMIHVSHGSKTRVNRDEAILKRNDWLPESSSLEINNHSIDTVFESRKIIESAIARQAALNINDKQLEELDALLKQQATMFSDPVRFQLSDHQFHLKIAEIAANPIMLNYSDELYAFGLKFRRQVMSKKGSIEQSYMEHLDIFNALNQRDADAAEQAMLRHIVSVHQTTVEEMGTA